MEQQPKTRKGDLAKPFNTASGSIHPHERELVKHLARMAAARDFKTLQEMSKKSYDKPPTKGKKT